MNISQMIAQELGVQIGQVERTLALIDQGDTIPFIARYRKEVTGQLTDVQLRLLNDRLTYLRSLQSRQEEVIRLIGEVGQLTPEIEAAIRKADKLSELEDIYRPFKPKRRTRATIAKEKGLEPLAVFMMANTDNQKIEEEALAYLSDELGVATAQEALDGAMDILAEQYADSAQLRDFYRRRYMKEAILVSQLGKDGDPENTYGMYHEYQELALKMPAHRVLAVNRGEREGMLRLRLDLNHEGLVEAAAAKTFPKGITNTYVESAFQDGYKRLVEPALARELRTQITEAAEEQAIGGSVST